MIILILFPFSVMPPQHEAGLVMVDTEQAGVHSVPAGVQQNGGDQAQHAAHQVPGFPGAQPGQQDINFANEVGG